MQWQYWNNLSIYYTKIDAEFYSFDDAQNRMWVYQQEFQEMLEKLTDKKVIE